MILQTPRLVVDLLKASDIDDFHRLHSDARVMKYTTGEVYSLDQSKTSLSQILRSYLNPDQTFNVWAVRLKSEENTMIGTCALVFNEHNEWEIGYRFMPSYWGKSMATELLKELEVFCFNNLNINMIVAYSYIENLGSINVLNRCGFQLDEEYRKPGDQRYFKHARGVSDLSGAASMQ